MRRRRQRRFIEIYFVLYLAALVLLLPDGNSNSKKESAILAAVLQQSFNAIPEQPVLNCVIDPNATNLIRFDSVNRILFGGNVKDIRYEAVIEDEYAGESILLVSDKPSPTPMFTLDYLPSVQAARFAWRPPIVGEKVNRTFVVRIRASATPIAVDNNMLNEMIKNSNTRVNTETSFSLNVVYSQTVPQITRPIDSPIIVQNTPVELPPTNVNALQPNTIYPVLSAQTQMEQIQAVSGQVWNNSVFIGGINSAADLKRTPLIRLEGSGAQQGGTAEITDVRGNQFVITGKVPSSGLMKVLVTAERRGDSKLITTSFIVEPQQMLNPILPSEMNPGVSYTFDPRMPIIAGTESKAVLRDSKGNEVMSSPRGASFVFTPSLTDTGKVLVFERWIGGRKVGQQINIPVKDYPAPEIVDIVPGGRDNVIQVKTRCYGLVKGKRNEVKIEVVEGNASVSDMRASIQYLDNNVTLQSFRITTTGTVRFRAYDQRGVRSAVRRSGE